MPHVRLRPLLVLAQALVPDLAWACAPCLDSAWGNRGFSWAFVGLMLAPFAVLAGLAGVLAWGYAREPRRPRAPRAHAGLERDRPGDSRPAGFEETTVSVLAGTVGRH
jgi:hypothetical protein